MSTVKMIDGIPIPVKNRDLSLPEMREKIKKVIQWYFLSAIQKN
jgi:hypothetical protein